jgi:hypothetical protein
MSYANMDNVPTQTPGTSELLATDWNTYVQGNFDAIKFGHIVVADTAARTALGNVAEGVMVYQADNQKLYVNSDGITANWVEVHDLDSNSALPSGSLLNNFFTDWTSFTPTWQNITNAESNEGWYLRVGSVYWVHARFICSNITSVSGTIRMTLPNSALWSNNYPNITTTPTGFLPLGNAIFYDYSTPRQLAGVVTPDKVIDHYTGPNRIDVINAANPWTWASLDEINVSFMFVSNSVS